MPDSVSKSERSRIMAAVKSTDTKPERLLRSLVSSLNFRYRLHVSSLPGTPDLVFSRLRRVINVSGCFWHMHGCGRCRIPGTRREYWVAKLERNAARDARTRRKLKRMGWRVLTIWECQLTAARVAATTRRIRKFLAQPAAGRLTVLPRPAGVRESRKQGRGRRRSQDVNRRVGVEGEGVTIHRRRSR